MDRKKYHLGLAAPFSQKNPYYKANIAKLEILLADPCCLTLDEIGKEFGGLTRQAIRLVVIRAGIQWNGKQRVRERIKKRQGQDKTSLTP